MKEFGIDISVYQNNFDLKGAMAEGVKFVILRGAIGLSVDKKFARNYSLAKTLGLPIGVYYFSKTLTVDGARKEAEYFYNNVLVGRQFELPVYIDIENKSQLNLGKRLVTDIAKTWLEYIEARKFCVGIYTSKSYFTSYFYDTELQKYTHWVAQWATSLTYKPVEVVGMWQFGGESNYIRTNQVAGVTCDQNYQLQDFSWIKTAGLNGFAPAALKSIEEIAREVISGKWGNGKERIDKLTAAGYNAVAVQAMVNAIITHTSAHEPPAEQPPVITPPVVEPPVVEPPVVEPPVVEPPVEPPPVVIPPVEEPPIVTPPAVTPPAKPNLLTIILDLLKALFKK